MAGRKGIMQTHENRIEAAAYIHKQRGLGLPLRSIRDGLENLFGINLTFMGVKNWIEKNPENVKLELIEIGGFDDCEVDFDQQMYNASINKDSSEIDKIKAKLVVLVAANLNSHITQNKRLNSEYLKHLKLVVEIQQTELKSEALAHASALHALAQHKGKFILQGLSLKSLTTSELKTLLELTEKVGFADSLEDVLTEIEKAKLRNIVTGGAYDLEKLTIEQHKDFVSLLTKLEAATLKERDMIVVQVSVIGDDKPILDEPKDDY